MDRKEKQELHKELIDLLLKNTKDNDEFFNKLIYACNIISHELSCFEKQERR